METPTQPDFTRLSKPVITYSRSYNEKIKSSLLTKDDLRSIYTILAKKSDEAADIEINLYPNAPEQTKEAFKNLKGKLWIQIWGENNEYISGDHESIFDNNRFPKKILRINFNGYNGYQFITQNRMHNWFELQFDFNKTEIFNFSKIIEPNNQNNSYFSVQGTNETWVDGVYQAINLFLKDKSLTRNWLYFNFTYDLLLYLLFFPIIFRGAYRLGALFHISNLTIPLRTAIYIYFFIIFLYAFRILFNYTKWIYPIIELKNGQPAVHRNILIVILLGIFGSASYDLIKSLFQFLF